MTASSVVPACPACTASTSEPFYASLTVCRSCTHVWADLAVDWAMLSQIYQQSYFFGDEYSDYLADRPTIEKNFSRRLATLRRFLRPVHTRLFEVGCAYGFFLHAARADFALVEGIDISEDAVAVAVRDLGVNATCGDLLAKGFDGRQFDVVCMWDTIEHLATPRQYLEHISAHVPAGGLVAITTGDISSAVAKIQRARWRLIHPPSHLQYFTRASLTRMLDDVGFTVRHVEYCGFSRSVRTMLHNLVALRWHNPRLADRLCALVPARLNLYLNLHDIMYVIAERR